VPAADGSVDIKLTDFGFSEMMPLGQDYVLGRGGCLNYSAPEIFFGQPYTPASDVFSMGCVFYEMLFGKKFVFFYLCIF
jgi:serine/threonine protein kinase